MNHDAMVFFYNFLNTVKRRKTRRSIEIEDVLKVTLNKNYIIFFLFLFVSSIFFLFILSMASADWLTDCLFDYDIEWLNILLVYFLLFFSKLTQSRWVKYRTCAETRRQRRMGFVFIRIVHRPNVLLITQIELHLNEILGLMFCIIFRKI